MTNEVIGLPGGRSLTRDDLDQMPDDGRRYELIDGLLIVSPAPRPVHQQALGNLHLALRAHCPADLQTLFAPLDVVLSDDTVLQPDLLVARRSDFTERDLPAAPILAVEILSPSTTGSSTQASRPSRHGRCGAEASSRSRRRQAISSSVSTTLSRSRSRRPA